MKKLMCTMCRKSVNKVNFKGRDNVKYESFWCGSCGRVWLKSANDSSVKRVLRNRKSYSE